ncbi:MAG: hypothetical protein A2X12_00585 [Bacteroidetes bacterium GWE2_29_8]|nr:MAG: hypothetical protein A2X12_00585 [Bacteroidetes bacterium GWE2_29_8]OFY17434.1 MAG: hypothetical protein A2X02_00880 [Bacteroidetes bacterium GWF2_29_10]
MKKIEEFAEGTRLLLVDDDIISVNYLESILSRKYPRMIFNIVYNGNDLFESIKYAKPDIILLDVNLPDADGYEICKKIKSDPQNNDIIIIFITANNSYEQITIGFKNGGSDYLTKPYNNEVLFARINTQLKIKHSFNLLKIQNDLLKIADERYKQIVENNSFAIIETDLNFKIKFYNKNFSNLFLIDNSNEIIDSHLFEIIDTDKEYAIKYINQINQNFNKTSKHHIKCKLSSSKNIIVKIDNINKNDQNNNLVGYFFIFEDTTDTFELNEKLEKANFVINNSESILFIWKAQNGWPVEYVSENISQYGYTPEDFMSNKIIFEDIIFHEDKIRVKEEVVFYTRSQNINDFSQEYRIRTKNNKIIWIEDKTTIVRNDKGIVINYIGIIVNITEKKKNQVIINEYQKNKENILTTEIESKEKELAMFLLKMSKSNELNVLTINTLSTILHDSELSNFNKNNIKSLIDDLKRNNSENIWDELKFRFENLHNDFYKNLLKDFPTLSKAELKLSTFLKLAMSSKEIANITFISPDSIKTARTRLRKKFNLDKDENLANFLSKY